MSTAITPIPVSDFTMRPVTSSMIAEIGYNSNLCMMQIRFKPRTGDPVGPLYQYANVTPDLWEKLFSADSIGKEFTRLVKKNPSILSAQIIEKGASQ